MNSEFVPRTIAKRTINLNKVSLRLLGANIFLLVAFFAAQMLMTSTIGTKTQEISMIRNRKDELRLQNEILVSEIEKQKSSLNTEEIAKKYGLTQKGVNFLDELNNDVALN